MEALDFCITYLEKINKRKTLVYVNKEDTLRALMNITMPYDLSDEFYNKQDEYLRGRASKLNIIDVDTLPFINHKISLYQGDITLLKADAIVNACNAQLLGCFSPLHKCIDNAIHSFAGLQVRRDLMELMIQQGHEEPEGTCKVTKGYNLPASYIFHTVGPQCYGNPTKENEEALKSCYLSCLHKAEELHLKSLVFCSISTGVYGYPISLASKIAYQSVKAYFLSNPTSSIERVVFNVFSDLDYKVYKNLLE